MWVWFSKAGAKAFRFLCLFPVNPTETREWFRKRAGLLREMQKGLECAGDLPPRVKGEKGWSEAPVS